MVNTYNKDKYGKDKTIMNEITEWFKSEIETLSDFLNTTIYESSILIDETTPLPHISIDREPIKVATDITPCIGNNYLQCTFNLMFFQEPTSREFYEYLLYYFEENIIKRFIYTTKLNYNSIPNRIESIEFINSTIETAYDNSFNLKYANVSKVSYKVIFVVTDEEIKEFVKGE